MLLQPFSSSGSASPWAARWVIFVPFFFSILIHVSISLYLLSLILLLLSSTWLSLPGLSLTLPCISFSFYSDLIKPHEDVNLFVSMERKRERERGICWRCFHQFYLIFLWKDEGKERITLWNEDKWHISFPLCHFSFLSCLLSLPLPHIAFPFLFTCFISPTV